MDRSTDLPLTPDTLEFSVDDILLAPLPLRVTLGGLGPFVINLQASSAPVDPPNEGIAGCRHAYVYRIQRVEDGRMRYRLRLGPFAREGEANAALVRVRDEYPGALTATACGEDLSAIAKMQAKGVPLQVLTEEPPKEEPPKEAAPAARVIEGPLMLSPPFSSPELPLEAAPSPSPIRSTVDRAAALSQLFPEPAQGAEWSGELELVEECQRPERALAALPHSTPFPVDAGIDISSISLSFETSDLEAIDPAVESALALGSEAEPPPEKTAGTRSSPQQTKPTQGSALPSNALPSKALHSVELPNTELASNALASNALPSNALRRVELPNIELPSMELPSMELPSIESTQTLRPLTASELENAASRWFVIQLSAAERPFDPATVPNLDIFVLYTLYSVEEADQGRAIHALRLGFFGEEMAAQAVANYLATYYDKATVKRVSAAERERFSERRIAARKDVGETGQHSAIEITNQLAAEKPRVARPTAIAAPKQRSAQPAKKEKPAGLFASLPWVKRRS